jgi:hypothetical protein
VTALFRPATAFEMAFADVGVPVNSA